MTWIIVLSVLIVLWFVGMIKSATIRMSFLEKEAEVMYFIEHYDSESGTTTYDPFVSFEVEAKSYQRKVRNPRQTKDYKNLIILYNPKNPSDCVTKEGMGTTSGGCVVLILLIVGLGIAVYFYLRQR